MKTMHEHFDTRRLNAISITEVARRLGCSIRKMGVVSKTHCPWHEDKNPSLTLYERTDENRCYCFSCGKGGSVIDYVMQQEHWSFQEACQWLSNEFGITTQPAWQAPRPQPKEPVKPTTPDYTYIPMDMVDELVSVNNSLCQCLMHMFQPEAVEWIVEEYRIGSYSLQEVDDYTVFPSIDRHGRVCNLKVQHYDADPTSPRFGHSDKGSCRWLASIWVRENRFPKESVFRSDCLFGEHLLTQYPDSMVALVESPKNALFGALSFPQMVWVATGNKTMLKRQVLEPLRNRNVLVIPDCDAVDEWTTAILGMADLANFTISSFCQQVAPPDNPKFDIADYLQQEILSLIS